MLILYHLRCRVLWNDSYTVDYSLLLHWILVRLNLIFIFRYIFISIIYFLYDILIFCYYTIRPPIQQFHAQGYFFYPWLTKNKYYPSSSFPGYKKINFFPGFIRCIIDRIQYTVTHKSPRTFYKKFLRKSISSKRSTLERRTTTTYCYTGTSLIIFTRKAMI